MDIERLLLALESKSNFFTKLNVYPCTLSIVSSTCVVSTRLKIMVVLGVLGAVARTCVFVFKCN